MTLDLTDTMTLEAIAVFIDEHHYPPTFREIAELTGMTSPSMVKRRLERLVKLGAITFVPDSPRTIVIQRVPDA